MFGSGRLPPRTSISTDSISAITSVSRALPPTENSTWRSLWVNNKDLWYKVRPDIDSVVHSHSPSVIPFGLVGVKMQAMFHNAAFLAAGVPVFDISEKFGATDMLVSDPAKGVALAEALGGKDIALMRAHGAVACGPTLLTAVFRAVYTEVSARRSACTS